METSLAAMFVCYHRVWLFATTRLKPAFHNLLVHPGAVRQFDNDSSPAAGLLKYDVARKLIGVNCIRECPATRDGMLAGLNVPRALATTVCEHLLVGFSFKNDPALEGIWISAASE